VKSKKVLVIIGLCVLIVVGLVAGLAKAIELGNSERDGRGSSDDSSIGLFVIFISSIMTAMTTLNAKRQKDKAQQDQENGV